ncbi:MAG: NAD(P)/FAD-dependent oxidoreductase [Thaumarchaeota archaeon]|nr:NAD(P)/FAD-dependent oxidoreductase [Nitrososphaerota archaeon]
MDYDIIVAGGGVAGLTTAIAAAKYSKQNLRILVVDRNSREEVGKKSPNGWICGDAVSKRSLEYAASNSGVVFSEPEIEHRVKGVLLFSPDRETSVLFEGEGYLLNRRLFSKKQMLEAERLGVEFRFNIVVTGLLSDNERVIGVVGRDVHTNAKFTARCKLVVDATGASSRLRANLPIKSKVEREIDRDDLEATGRYIYTFTPKKEDRTYFDPEYCVIHLDQDLAPGGYCWTFPKGVNKVNIGLGVQKRALDERNKRLGRIDTLQSLIDSYVKGNSVLGEPRLSQDPNDQGNTFGNWQVPVRRQNECLVANGYALVGDAAWMPRPIDAGGIGPSLYGGTILAKVAVEAVEASDTSEEGLWRYNLEYMRIYGYQMASFEVLRRYLQTLPNDDINYGMKHFLSKDDIEHITRREHPAFNKVQLFNPTMWLRIMQRPKLAKGLKTVSETSRRLINHNLNYPDKPSKFYEWQRDLHTLLNQAYQELGLVR